MSHERRRYFNAEKYANVVQVRSPDGTVVAEARADDDKPTVQATICGEWPEEMAEEIASETLAWREQAAVSVEWGGTR